MQKIILTVLLCMGLTMANAQDEVKVQRNEIKLNALNLILGNPELTYEYLIDANSGFGIFGNINIDNNRAMNYNYMAGMYYRLYVGGKYASGFFFEGGVTALGVSDYHYNYPGPDTEEKSNRFGPMVAIGGKFLIKRSIVFEFFGGIGRSMFSSGDDGDNAFPRIGISIGKRF
jgi:hypothetical protein